MIKSAPCTRDGCRVGEHAQTPGDLGKVVTRNVHRQLIADAELEAGSAPVDELDGALRLEGRDSGVGVLGDDITTVQQAGGHVLAVSGVALDHLVVGLEAGHGHLLDRVGLVRGLGSRDDRGVGDQGEVNTGVGNEVGLELVQVDVERAVEAERGGDGGDNYKRSVVS